MKDQISIDDVKKILVELIVMVGHENRMLDLDHLNETRQVGTESNLPFYLGDGVWIRRGLKKKRGAIFYAYCVGDMEVMRVLNRLKNKFKDLVGRTVVVENRKEKRVTPGTSIGRVDILYK